MPSVISCLCPTRSMMWLALALGLEVCALGGGLAGCRESRQIDDHPDAFAGIGVELEMLPPRQAKPGTEPRLAPTVVRVFEGGPAAAGGIKAYDRIIAINGSDMLDRPLGEAVVALRGADDSQVLVTVEGNGRPANESVMLRRRRMQADAPLAAGAATATPGAASPVYKPQPDKPLAAAPATATPSTAPANP